MTSIEGHALYHREWTRFRAGERTWKDVEAALKVWEQCRKDEFARDGVILDMTVRLIEIPDGSTVVAEDA